MDHLMKCLLCAVVSAVLFFVLSPGVLLTLPPCKGGKVLLSLQDDKDNCSTSYTAAGRSRFSFRSTCILTLPYG